MPHLLDPLQVGALRLPNRIIMAPLTRLRGSVDHLPTPVMVEYYTQRASAGLIITEGTPVSPQAVGYAQVPGIWSEAQTAGWRPVTEAVHRAGGRIFAQIWHVGRISDPVFFHGNTPVAPSALQAPGHVSLLRPEKPFVTPRALDLSEIPGIVGAFKQAAENAKAAGFDGVEIHGANGYLLDQFLQSGTNGRTDAYGGSVGNRARLMLEVADAVCEVWGPERVGMHLAPRSDMHGISDANLPETFGYVARELGKRKLAFLMAREFEAPGWLGPRLKEQFGGVYIANERFTQATAEAAIERGDCDAVGFGKLWIANPDLVERFREGAALNTPDPQTFYAHERQGYVDYPALQGAFA